MSRIKLMLLSLALIVFIVDKSHANADNDEDMSNRWVLQIDKNHKLDNSNENTEQLIKRLAAENNFRVLRKVGALDDVFMVEFNEHRFKRSLGTFQIGHSHHDSDSPQIRRKREVFIKNSADSFVKSHSIVSSLNREKRLVRKKRDFIEDIVDNNQLLGRRDNIMMPKTRFPTSNELFRAQNSQFGASFGGPRFRNKLTSPMAKRMALVSLSRIDQDPYWPQMWYLNRNLIDSSKPDMNVTSAWHQGYSGRGVSVTFLDDGLEWNHPDLQQNYDPKASTDINDNDDDPMPRYESTNENKHGTRCAGEVAAVANNSICSVGVAYNAGVGGVRMLDGDVTDSVEASSLSHNIRHVEIYSASWGPDDNGEVVDGPGPLAKKAFEEGALNGRNGLGSIYVWASGNGGRFNDSCSCDGYANSIYTLSISSTTEFGDKPWYLEECTSTLATTYSSGNERMGEREIMTTDLNHQCTSKHTGTSAAAPLAAGIIALALEAKPDLTWRDVMHIIVLSSRADVIRSNNYIINKRGFLVSNRYGFGLMDAGRMVELAKTWKTVPEMATCSTINSNFKINSVYQVNSIETIITTDACKDTINEVNFIEQVEIIVTIQAPIRGQLEIFLTSPMGTKSLILPKRSKDMSSEGFKRWSFMTVQLWGELARGDWKLVVKADQLNDIKSIVHLEDVNLKIHGTKLKPVDYESLMRTDPAMIIGIKDENNNLTQHINVSDYFQLLDAYERSIHLLPVSTSTTIAFSSSSNMRISHFFIYLYIMLILILAF